MTHVAIYLPTEMGGYDGCIEHARDELAKRFGGFTEYDATGGWRHGGETLTEPVTVVEAYGDVSHENAVIFMNGVAQYVRGYNLYDETAIMYTVDNQQYLVQ